MKMSTMNWEEQLEKRRMFADRIESMAFALSAAVQNLRSGRVDLEDEAVSRLSDMSFGISEEVAHIANLAGVCAGADLNGAVEVDLRPPAGADEMPF
jgi:hypothetical protein